jgi:hypothetical protein
MKLPALAGSFLYYAGLRPLRPVMGRVGWGDLRERLPSFDFHHFVALAVASVNENLQVQKMNKNSPLRLFREVAKGKLDLCCNSSCLCQEVFCIVPLRKPYGFGRRFSPWSGDTGIFWISMS